MSAPAEKRETKRERRLRRTRLAFGWLLKAGKLAFDVARFVRGK